MVQDVPRLSAPDPIKWGSVSLGPRFGLASLLDRVNSVELPPWQGALFLINDETVEWGPIDTNIIFPCV